MQQHLRDTKKLLLDRKQEAEIAEAEKHGRGEVCEEQQPDDVTHDGEADQQPTHNDDKHGDGKKQGEEQPHEHKRKRRRKNRQPRTETTTYDDDSKLSGVNEQEKTQDDGKREGPRPDEAPHNNDGEEQRLTATTTHDDDTKHAGV